ncbi:two-component system, OmpR family, sensor histidine kinase TctE [Cognatiyoonia sediminum]|uniref:histidine kinase n=1 Tax=Cognatiyoonia sediminum TaxID=1508389 RepID=A0A1M5NQR5_9RHOB|nr:sensor histidine kinase [Cognatiyoonia sediminum]SHG91817.1 two-component system, OmpR family, sensor histidine kinase TctE [Cognatiyoonia sediminum]
MQTDAVVSGSLRNRLVLILIGGAAVLAIFLFFAVRSYAVQVAQRGQDNILLASVTSMLDAAAFRDGVAEVDIPYAAFSMLNTPADDRVFYAIYQDDTFLSGYNDLGLLGENQGGQPSFQTRDYRDTSVREVTASRTLIGADQRTEIQIALAQTQDALADTLDQISRNAALLGLGFFALAVALSIWATQATISPLSRLTNSVTRRGPQDLSPFTKPVPQEMAPLVTSLNSLMGRLDQSLSQSEDFIAEAAHRVRTPLATVRSYAEATLLRVNKEENREAMRSMVKAIDESSRAAGQLLDHAMITFRADHLEREELDLVDLVRDLILRLTPVADMKDLTLDLRGEDTVTYAGDPILLQNALRNMIDNAMKYSPADGAIEISVRSEPVVAVTVSDQGPGFPLDEIETLTARFTRGRNADNTIGSGLGLTIAQDVATAHGGEITLRNREEGGACVILSL